MLQIQLENMTNVNTPTVNPFDKSGLRQIGVSVLISNLIDSSERENKTNNKAKKQHLSTGN